MISLPSALFWMRMISCQLIMIGQYLKIKLDSTLILEWSTFHVDKEKRFPINTRDLEIPWQEQLWKNYLVKTRVHKFFYSRHCKCSAVLNMVCSLKLQWISIETLLKINVVWINIHKQKKKNLILPWLHNMELAVKSAKHVLYVSTKIMFVYIVQLTYICRKKPCQVALAGDNKMQKISLQVSVYCTAHWYVLIKFSL